MPVSTAATPLPSTSRETSIVVSRVVRLRLATRGALMGTVPAEGRLLFRLRARVAGVRGDRRGRAPGGVGAPPGGTHGGQDPEGPSGTPASPCQGLRPRRPAAVRLPPRPHGAP